IIAVVCLTHACGSGDAASSPPILDVAQKIPLPGPAVRFDYQSLDTAHNRLYISHMDAGEVVVFDAQNRVVVDTIGGLPRVTGVLAVSSLNRTYASVTGNHEVVVIDDSTLAPIAHLGPIGFPDGIAYAPSERKIYVSDESGGGELVIDAATNHVVTTIPIGGE